MKKSLFEYNSYKAYIKDLIRQNPAYGHGFRSKMAEALRVQTAYISQVLNRGANFSLEQAEDLNELLKHSFEEGHFFQLLVQKERSGSKKLTDRLNREIELIRNQREDLKHRVEKTDQLSLEHQVRYYSHWVYAAVHIIVMLPEYQEKEKIKEALGLPMDVLNETIEFLTKTGLIIQEGAAYKPGLTQMFLPNDSPMISKLHTNWRVKAIEAIDRQNPNDLHYSICISVSKKDYKKIKNLLIDTINESSEIVKPSKEEDLCVLNMDLFSLIQN